MAVRHLLQDPVRDFDFEAAEHVLELPPDLQLVRVMSGRRATDTRLLTLVYATLIAPNAARKRWRRRRHGVQLRWVCAQGCKGRKRWQQPCGSRGYAASQGYGAEGGSGRPTSR